MANAGSAEFEARLRLDELIKDAERAAKLLKQELKDQNLKINVDNSGLDQLTKKLSDVDGLIAGFAGGATLAGFQALQGAIASIVAGLQNLIGTALQVADQFNAATAAVNSLGSDGESVAKAARQLSNDLGGIVTSTDILQSSYDVLSSKTDKLVGNLTDAEVATKILDASVRGAVGGFSSTNTVADALTSILNSYGLSADQAAAVTDKLAATQNRGKITIDQYAQQIGRLAPIAAQAGVSLDELNGFIATATVSGLPVESTFAGIRQAISSILKPTEEAKALSKSLGIEFNATALRTKGLSGILGELNAAGADTQDNLAVLFGSVEALAAIAPSTGQAFGTLKSNIDASANSAGAAQKAFEAVAGSVETRLKASTNSLNESLLTLGQTLQPIQLAINELFASVLQEAVDGNEAFKILEEAANRFSETLKANPEVVKALGNAVGELAEALARVAALGIDALGDLLASGNFAQFIDNIGTTIELINLLIGAFQVLDNTFGGTFDGVADLINPLAFGVGDLISIFGLLIDTVKTASAAIQQLPAIKFIQDALQQLEALAQRLGILQAEQQSIAPSARDNYASEPRTQAATPTATAPAAPKPAAAADTGPSVDRLLSERENAYKESQARIAQLLAAGNKTEQQARLENLNLERDYLNDRLSLTQQKLEELRSAEAKATDPKEREKIGQEILKTEAAISDARLQIAQSGAKLREETERQALERVARANADAENRIAQSQQQRVQAIRQSQLDGSKSAEDAAREIEQIELDSSAKIIEQKQKELAEIQRLRAVGTISAEEAGKREVQLSQEIGQANIQRLEREIELRRKAAEELINRKFAPIQLELNTTADNQGLQLESLRGTNDLLSAQANLQSALASLENARFDRQIQAAQTAGDEAKAQQLKLQQLQSQARQQEQAFQLQQQQLKLQQESRRLELESEKTRAQIAQTEAQIALAKAKANGASADEIKNLERILQLRNQQVGQADAAIARQGQIDALQTATLNVQQQAGREQIAGQIRSQRSAPNGSQQPGTGQASGGNTASTPRNIYRADGTLTAEARDRMLAGLNPSASAEQIDRNLGRNVLSQLQTPVPALNLPNLAAQAGAGASLPDALKLANQPVVSEIQALRAEINRLASSPRQLTVQTPDPVRNTGQILGAIGKNQAQQARL